MNERCEKEKEKEKERRERRKMKENGEATGADDVRCVPCAVRSELRAAGSRQRAAGRGAVGCAEWRVESVCTAALRPLSPSHCCTWCCKPSFASCIHTSHMTHDTHLITNSAFHIHVFVFVLLHCHSSFFLLPPSSAGYKRKCCNAAKVLWRNEERKA